MELDLEVRSALRHGLSEAEARGESVIALMDSDQVLALIALADQVRPSARAAIAELNTLGMIPVMITGDAEAVAKTVADDLGIERFYARVLPQDKARIVRELKTSGPTVFVGDGINDAPALQEADMGVAIGAGTNVAIESADLVLVENDPLAVIAALRLSRASYHKWSRSPVGHEVQRGSSSSSAGVACHQGSSCRPLWAVLKRLVGDRRGQCHAPAPPAARR
jgi:Cu2+-exporting ATPase